MSILARPAVASFAARMMQRGAGLAARRSSGRGSRAAWLERLPEFPRDTRELTIPASVAPAPAVVHLPDSPEGALPPVHVNFHGGGFVLPGAEMDDALCRFLAAEAGVVVVNVEYAVAPPYRFPAPPRQAYDIVRWVAEHGTEQGWDGSRLTVGGQSAGGNLAAAVARQAFEEDGPSIALQVLHYPPLDLATDPRNKHAAIAKPMLRPWLGDIFDSAYAPDRLRRSDRLISPANAADTVDLTGIAPALVITAEHDLLRAEGKRYAERLDKAGALVEHHDVRGVDHGYDLDDAEAARPVYALIAGHLRRATEAKTGTDG
jgi:acetyl esterase